MKKIFISYKFRGETKERLDEVLPNIWNTFEDLNQNYFCAYKLNHKFKEKGWNNDRVFEFCLNKLENCDIFLPVIWSPEESIGMAKESKLAEKLGKDYILAIKEELEFENFRSAADSVVEYNNFEDLYGKLSNFSEYY